jgi:molybdenum transport protein
MDHGYRPLSRLYPVLQPGVLCGTEEAVRICRKLNIQVGPVLASGSRIAPNQIFFEVYGKAEALHMLWKVALNIFEYCTGVAGRVRALVDKVQRLNPQISVRNTAPDLVILAAGGIHENN